VEPVDTDATPPPGGKRRSRRRRSALQTPGFVDRMDEADDAAGRVVIFSVEPAADLAPPAPPRDRAAPRGSPSWIGALADDSRGAAALAVGLVLLLVLGLRLTH
jgi:hypothetical protein